MNNNNFKERELECKKFFDILSKHTDLNVDLHMISHQSLFDRSLNKKLVIAKNVDISEAFNILKKENCFYKNEVRKENIYFSFSKENEKFNICFVDDIVSDNVLKFMNKKNFLLIQTSQKKFQGYFLLSRHVNYDELLKIQKMLAVAYEGDKGAVSPAQLKRIAGFVNTKYDDNFVVKINYIGNNVLDVDMLLKYYDKVVEKSNKQEKQEKSLKQVLEEKLKQKTEKRWEKKWIDFYSGDESQADFKYVLYLLGKGYSDDEIKDKLLEESLDIYKRKGKYVDSYIDMTIRKARSVFKPLKP